MYGFNKKAGYHFMFLPLHIVLAIPCLHLIFWLHAMQNKGHVKVPLL